MGPTEAFETQTGRYEEWFEENEPTYRSEVRALDRFVDTDAFGLEIGIGTGRFAEPLGIDVGIDPALEMLAHAVQRERSVVQGVAEWLPFRDGVFDVALIVTTICFVDDIERTLEEAGRVLHSDGRLVMGYIDRESEYGRHYQAIKDENPFYRDATFVSTDELLADLDALGYGDVDIVQTVFGSPGEHDQVDEPRPGYGDGSFVALSARAPN
ncbi:MAG: class I SAM-dependent methyltransferase [Halobacteriota archaeon]